MPFECLDQTRVLFVIHRLLFKYYTVMLYTGEKLDAFRMDRVENYFIIGG